jgi:hypothetical protein
VKGHIAPALGLEQLDTFARQELGRCDQVLFFRGCAEGDYRGVLEQEENILRDGASDPISREVALKLERCRVGHAPESDCP